MYGKQTETGIAALSRLAELYDGNGLRVSATDIADARNLNRPMVRKILSALAQAGLVVGSPGPGGGYQLARPPKDICLYDVFRIFEREDQSTACPFGGGVCGQGEPCAIHDRLVDIKVAVDTWMRETSFEDFRAAYQDEGLQPADGTPEKPRESYRAPARRARA